MQLLEVGGRAMPFTPESRRSLRFDGKGKYRAEVGNYFEGDVRIEGDRLHFGKGLVSAVGFSKATLRIETFVRRLVRDDLRWRLKDARLILSAHGVRMTLTRVAFVPTGFTCCS
jgi:heat shock protein HslJ